MGITMKTGTKQGREAVAKRIKEAVEATCPNMGVTINSLAILDRSLYVDIDTHAYGLRASIEIDPKSGREGYIVHWHGIANPKISLVPTFTDSVNCVHAHKATTFADDIDTLIYKLEECLLDVIEGEGSAFRECAEPS
jgi:hypothetical protein